MTLSEAKTQFEKEKGVFKFSSTDGVNWHRSRKHTPSYLEFYNWMLENYGTEVRAELTIEDVGRVIEKLDSVDNPKFWRVK